MSKTAKSTSAGRGERGPSAAVIAVNAAAVALADELLRLPSASSVETVVALLFGREGQVPPALLAHVNGGMHAPLGALLASPRPLAAPLAHRLRVAAGWRADAEAVRRARALARARYRDLQSAFLAIDHDRTPDPAAALVRYTFGCEGRQWAWEDAAARLLHRVTALNRAVLDLLGASARGEIAVEWPGPGIASGDFDLPERTLDLLAAALPPVAVPDWDRLVAALAHDPILELHGEESVARYRALLAEILGREESR